MNPITYYQKQCDTGLISADQQQLAVLQFLQRIHIELMQENQKRNRLLGSLRKPRLVQGLYLWGGVGIGKTFLMDCFYHTLPFPNKLRMHFHSFMQMIHRELRAHQGKKNPLQEIARKLAKSALVICFDEFFVTDIADAMLLARLFKALFSHGVCLVATSNTHPDGLYKNGLQRALFLPAIAMLKEHTHVLHVPTTTDYRLRQLNNAGVFYTPNDELANENMEKCFALLADGAVASHAAIKICGRFIPVRKHTQDLVWFDFEKICTVPRSQHDYLEIAEQFSTVFISDIPKIPANANNMINLFIRMVDVFYDARVRLVFSAAAPISEIYTHGYMATDYIRTCSRLVEMQSENYFTKKQIITKKINLS